MNQWTIYGLSTIATSPGMDAFPDGVPSNSGYRVAPFGAWIEIFVGQYTNQKRNQLEKFSRFSF